MGTVNLSLLGKAAMAQHWLLTSV